MHDTLHEAYHKLFQLSVFLSQKLLYQLMFKHNLRNKWAWIYGNR